MTEKNSGIPPVIGTPDGLAVVGTRLSPAKQRIKRMGYARANAYARPLKANFASKEANFASSLLMVSSAVVFS